MPTFRRVPLRFTRGYNPAHLRSEKRRNFKKRMRGRFNSIPRWRFGLRFGGIGGRVPGA